jgi:hypothetical protein
MNRRIITCDRCGYNKPHHARGWCHACWDRWDRAGQPPEGPPPRRTGRYGEYFELTREHHYSLKNAAARMGVSERTAQRYETRLKQEGAAPATYECGRYGVLVTRPAAFSAQYGQEVA